MFWVVLAAASQMIAPQPQRMWIRVADLREQLLPPRRMALVWIRLTVSPQGTLMRCEVEESSSVAALDAYTCDLTLERAKFRPARTAAGASAYGIYRVPILWSVQPVFPDPEGDLELTVNRLPSGVHSPTFVRVALAVDASGDVSSCTSQPPPVPGGPPNNPKLVTIACAQISKDFPAAPAIDENGKAVASIQTASVVFTESR